MENEDKHNMSHLGFRQNDRLKYFCKNPLFRKSAGRLINVKKIYDKLQSQLRITSVGQTNDFLVFHL